MYRLALLGRNIGYTRSPEIHAAIAQSVGEKISFDVIDVTYDGLEQAVGRLLGEYDGFFVTKPYKLDIKKYSDRKVDGGVNVVRSKDGAAFNTDGSGFIRALDRRFGLWRDDVKSVLLIGAGGAAHSVASALIGLGKKVYVLNRTLMHALKLCTATGAELYVNQPAELAVNCTSLGTGGEDVLRSLCVLPDFKYAFDLVYSGGVTPFMRRCGASGADVADGRDMLVYQAIEGDGIIFDRKFDVENVYASVTEILEKRG